MCSLSSVAILVGGARAGRRRLCSAIMGNTASERVSGERHSSKSHRSDGASSTHHAKDHSHKIMVGSTDDPNVFSTHDSKLPEEKGFVSWHHDLDESIKPTQQARPTVIRWTDGGKEVFISGSFNNWSTKIPLIKSHNDFVAILDLPEGEHQYKFFVDGQWVHDSSELLKIQERCPPFYMVTLNNMVARCKREQDSAPLMEATAAEIPSPIQLLKMLESSFESIFPKQFCKPVVTSQMGTINNIIHVKKSDFEVFDALKVDSLESSEISCRDLSGSPPGIYGQEMYVYRPEERFKSPPILPPHLLQVILNKDTNVSCDPALLPEPNHVMLNHLYALSIKDGVMVLSATHRYKKKYVTTLLYKPI